MELKADFLKQAEDAIFRNIEARSIWRREIAYTKRPASTYVSNIISIL